MSDLITSDYAEYDFVDKSDWGPGEWLNEPDKVTWIDPKTDYPCIVLRGAAGSFCGYVGVPIYHPAYGLSYDGYTQDSHNKRSTAFREALRKADKSKNIIEQINFDELPEKPVVADIGDKILNISVHGGLTYSGSAVEPTKNSWEMAKKYAEKAKTEALIFPHGDAADFIKEWSPILNDYEAWSKRMLTKGIGLGKLDDENWYFGFDCCHCNDLSPGMGATLKAIGHIPLSHKPPDFLREVYRNLEYVKNEVVSLAKQLKLLA
jgi:hypothetical protein